MTSRMQIWTLAKRLHRQLPSCWMLPSTICDVIVISVRKWWRRTSFTTSLHLCKPRERYLSLFTATKLPLEGSIIIKFMYHCSTTTPKMHISVRWNKNLQFTVRDTKTTDYTITTKRDRRFKNATLHCNFWEINEWRW